MRRIFHTLAVIAALVLTTGPVAAKSTLSAEAPAAPKGWKSKTFTDATMYQATFGALAVGSKTGYLELMLYNPKPLNGKPLDGFLADFVKDQEQFFKITDREPAIMDGPHRAWDFLRAKNKKGTALNISYIAIRTGENSVRIVREVVTDKYHAKRNAYASGIGPVYGQIERETAPAYRASDASKTIDGMVKRLRTESRKQKRARRKAAKATSNARFLANISTAPGKGIQMAQLHGIFLRRDYLKRAYGKGNPRSAIFFLLKDGTAYQNPSRPPSDLNTAASRRIEPRKWHQWRKTGKGYEILYTGKPSWKAVKGKLAKPAPRRTLAFRGRFIRAWGDVLMGNSGFSQGGITLTSEGRFETSSFSLAGGSGITGLPAATVAVSKSKKGVQSTTSSNIAPALINNTKRDPNGTDYTGQYALDGYTAEFLTDSGKLTRTLFLMPGRDSIYLQGRNYSVPKKKKK